MREELKFAAPDTYNERQLMRSLSGQFVLKKEPASSEDRAFYDTFDWRLFNRSLFLMGTPGELSLCRLGDSRPVLSADIASQPVFVRNLPGSELKQYLEPIVETRALLKLFETHFCSRLFRVLNQDEKTVARLMYEEIRLLPRTEGPPFAVHLWLQSVRGYENSARQLVRHLKQVGLAAAEDDLYCKALAATEKKPGDYSSKLDVQLEPGMRADQATKIILSALLRTIKSNEEGVRRDIDTEFLHDFRVAIRRTRSVLGQVKPVFPAAVVDRFKEDFTFLGRMTNRLRDLDVYLLHGEAYRAMLSASLRPAIEPLFQYLQKERSEALGHVLGWLNSIKYDQIMQDWEAFLNALPDDSATGSSAALPIVDLARNRIYARYRSIVKAGRRLAPDSEDEMLHNLRIEFKKLRYLMEFFSTLFPARKINTLIKQLKALQDQLGRFQDLCVQAEELLHFSVTLPLLDHQAKITNTAVGSLIGALDREKQSTRSKIAQPLADFVSSSNQELFRQLFAPDKKKAAP